MRNEGIWLLEWVAHYRTLGFDRLVIFTNDCTDGTDLMLDRLTELGEVVHVRNADYGAEGPQARALYRAMADIPEAGRADWLLLVDADEFLKIDHGDHSLDALLDAIDGFDACALAWVPFGDNGHRLWPEIPVMAACTARDDRPKWSKLFHKPLFRPKRFARIGPHMPKFPKSPGVRQCNGAGEEISP
ncbi:MAG: glycosyltransferase family 2 protein, partial [Pseudomonadota bacterium]